MKLYGRLSALASDITGKGVDFKPTDQQEEVYSIFNKRLKSVDSKFKTFMNVEVKNSIVNLRKVSFKYNWIKNKDVTRRMDTTIFESLS